MSTHATTAAQGQQGQHTPGPWEITPCKAFDGIGNAFEVQVESETLAHVYPSQDMDANARLIAAAPELLAAMQAISPLFDNDSCLLDAYRAEIAQFDAAIAKAQGKP